MKKGVLSEVRLCLFTAGLGAVCGAVVWVFLKLVNLCKDVLWEVIPEATGISWTPVVLCTLGGLLMGLVHKRYGDYPDELHVVLGKIKNEHRYDYGALPVILVCAFIPLIFGASVGPEAGLAGVIAGLCYWVGDNVRYAGEHLEDCSKIGVAAALGSLFHVPLFGVFAVEEPDGSEQGDTIEAVDSAAPAADVAPESTEPIDEQNDEPTDESTDKKTDKSDNSSLPRPTRYLLYGISIAAAFIAVKILTALLGPTGEGIPSFDYTEPTAADYVLMLLYVPVGCILFLWFEAAENLTKKAAGKVPAIAREALCGLCVGVMSLLVPVVLFSGEDRMAHLPEVFAKYSPAALIGVCLLKMVMTAFCIQFGLKGGHFFPLIFACSCMGFGFAAISFGMLAGVSDAAVVAGHGVFAAAVVTASCLGSQIRKPVAVALLLMLCFPLKYVVWIFAAAAVGAALGRRASSAE